MEDDLNSAPLVFPPPCVLPIAAVTDFVGALWDGNYFAREVSYFLKILEDYNGDGYMDFVIVDDFYSAHLVSPPLVSLRHPPPF